MRVQHHAFQTLVSETHSLHAQANGKIQLVIEVEPSDRKVVLEAFSKPGAALAVVRLPSVFDRSGQPGYYSEEDAEGNLDHIIFH